MHNNERLDQMRKDLIRRHAEKCVIEKERDQLKLENEKLKSKLSKMYEIYNYKKGVIHKSNVYHHAYYMGDYSGSCETLKSAKAWIDKQIEREVV